MLPFDGKTHIIIPVFKSGNKNQVNNYRPISLLCITSKVLEHLIYNKLIDHVINFISPFQFGFLRGRSCMQQLLMFLINKAYRCATNSTQCDTIYLDFRKAFDSIPHTNLLVKLYKIGIRGKVWKWFQCYLLGRYQCEKINSTLLDILPVL